MFPGEQSEGIIIVNNVKAEAYLMQSVDAIFMDYDLDQDYVWIQVR